MTAVNREPRRALANESPLNPLSLVGSWALYESDDFIEQALVVGEPQPGVYLIEVYDLVTDEPSKQRLVRLDELCKELDDCGGSWRFYDSHADVRAAFRVLIKG